MKFLNPQWNTLSLLFITNSFHLFLRSVFSKYVKDVENEAQRRRILFPVSRLRMYKLNHLTVSLEFTCKLFYKKIFQTKVVWYQEKCIMQQLIFVRFHFFIKI